MSLLLAISVMCASCLFTQKATVNTDAHLQQFSATGTDTSFLKALARARKGVLSQAVIALVGVYSESQHQVQLQKHIYNSENPSIYLPNDKLIILKKEAVGTDILCAISAAVNMDVLREALQSLDITSMSEPSTVALQAKEATQTVSEAAFLRDYIAHMTVMVYPDEHADIDPFLMKSAVDLANNYLITQGKRTVDFAEVRALQKESIRTFNARHHEGMSIQQWMAQKLNADVYMEITATVEGGISPYGYYGLAKATINVFNPSTGALLAAMPYTSQKTFSTVSIFDAQSNALQSTIYKIMPLITHQTQQRLESEYAHGIRYEVTFTNTADPRAMSDLRRAIQKRVSQISTVHQSLSATKYAISFFGTIEELENIVYTATQEIAGMEQLTLLVLRGKTLTFDAGL